MWDIVFARVDDRLIHGQIMTRWLKGFPAKTVIIINDLLAIDDYMKSIYTMAAPPGVKVKVMSINEFVEESSKPGEEKAFILFKDIESVEKVIDAGVNIKFLNIGGVAKMAGKKTIIQSVSLNDKEAEILKDLHKDKGVEIYFQMVPDSERLNIDYVIEKFFPKLK